MSFFWFDYETFGTHPALDRPAQFAGLRTDESFKVIDEALTLHCRPANDFLPDPTACLITGITPENCLQKGVPECEFITAIHDQMAQPGTCNIGYNNIRFDDEFTRHILYRNFFNPYEHEWKNGNSRWDLLDIVRLTRALRPDGIHWPVHADGSINNTLAAIAQLNGIEHQHAHDALSDVYATIAVARLLKEKKPKLFDFAFRHRDKHNSAALLNLREQKVVVHVSGMISGDFAHTAVVLPLSKHPVNSNGILVYDLRIDPRPFLELGPESLARQIFTSSEELQAAQLTRLPVKTIHLNRCPVIVPLNTLDEAAQQRTQISLTQSLQFADILRERSDFASNLQQAFKEQPFRDNHDTDSALYSGGFFTESDYRAFERIRKLAPEELDSINLFYDDKRIPEMLFRYQARNYPQTLNQEDKQRWDEYRLSRVIKYCPSQKGLTGYLSNLQQLIEQNPLQRSLLESLNKYAINLFPEQKQ